MVRFVFVVLAVLVILPSAASAQVSASTGYGYVAPETAIPCGEGGVCAAGSSCVSGLCYAPDGSMSAPVVADAEYEHRSSIHRRLMIAGGVTLGASWIVDWVVSLFAGYHWAAFTTDSSSFFEPGWDAFRGVAFIPLIGPWIQLALHSQTSGWNLFLGIDGAVQTIGFGLLLLGGILELENHPDHPAFAVLPMIGDGTAGLVFSSEL